MTTRNGLLPLIVLVAMLGCKSAPAPTSAPSAAPSQESAPAATPVATTPDTGETAALAASGGKVSRRGATLTITTLSGPVTLADDSSDAAENYHIYQYVGRIPRTPFHGVHVSLFESAAYLLVNDSTGRRIDVLAAPIPSPSGKFLATGAFDLEAQMSPNAVTLYGRAADSTPVAFTIEPTEWGPDSLRWISDDTLAFTKLVSSKRGPGDYDRVKARLIRGAKGWTIVNER